MPLLVAHGYQVTVLSRAAELAALPAETIPDLLLLDLGLSDGDGLVLTEGVRKRHPYMGVVVLTGATSASGRIRALFDGADAYLRKPVAAELLLATLYSVARRLHRQRGHVVSQRRDTADWQLGKGGWQLHAPCGGAVTLTSSERPVMRCLFGNIGEVVSRDRLIATLTGDIHAFDTHRLESLIHRLRRKVAKTCGVALPLVAVPGLGYAFLP